jgi:hypothetical protein
MFKITDVFENNKGYFTESYNTIGKTLMKLVVHA